MTVSGFDATTLVGEPWPRGARQLRNIFANNDFTITYTAGALITTCQWIISLVLAGYTYEVTGSAVTVGIIAFAQFSPTLLLGLLTGALADRYARKLLLVVSALIQALAMAAAAAFILVDQASLLVLIMAAGAAGVGQAIYLPVFTAILPTFLPRPALPMIITLQSGQLSLGRIVGPIIGGVFLAYIGPGIALGVVALILFLVMTLLCFIHTPFFNPMVGGWATKLLGGLVVARNDRAVRNSLLSIAVFATCCLPILNHIPTLAAQFDVSTRDVRFGYLLTAFGVGAMIGGVTIGLTSHLIQPRKMARLSLLTFATFLLGLSLAQNLWQAYILLSFLGIAYFAVFTSLSIRLQNRLTIEVRGRVMALWVMSFGGMIPVGALIAGPIIETSSLAVILWGGVVAATLVASVGCRRLREDEDGEE